MWWFFRADHPNNLGVELIRWWTTSTIHLFYPTLTGKSFGYWAGPKTLNLAGLAWFPNSELFRKKPAPSGSPFGQELFGGAKATNSPGGWQRDVEWMRDSRNEEWMRDSRNGGFLYKWGYPKSSKSSEYFSIETHVDLGYPHRKHQNGSLLCLGDWTLSWLFERLSGYLLAIKHGKGKSCLYRWFSHPDTIKTRIFNCHVWLPESSPKFHGQLSPVSPIFGPIAYSSSYIPLYPSSCPHYHHNFSHVDGETWLKHPSHHIPLHTYIYRYNILHTYIIH